MKRKTLSEAVIEDLKAAGKELSNGSQIGADFILCRAGILALLDIADALREKTKLEEKK